MLKFLNNNIYFLWQVLGFEIKDATTILKDVWRSFCLNICQVVYRLTGFFYKLFILISQVNPVKEESIKALTNRMMLLLGIIMLFVSIFSLIKLLVDPDKINDKESGLGNIIKRMVVVILMLGFTPLMFEVARDVQLAIVNENVIPKIILGSKTKMDSSQLHSYGYYLEEKMFFAFFKDAEGLVDKDVLHKSNKCGEENMNLIKAEIRSSGTFEYAHYCVNKKGYQKHPNDSQLTVDVYSVDYDEIISVIVGIIMLWMMIVYTINTGVRSIQLLFLEIISPIPIISYIVPKKDSMLNKWIKQVITTYVDLFIRIAIIYFVIFVTRDLWTYDLTFYDKNLKGITPEIENWIKIIITLALFLFAKRLPQLLQELTGKPSAASIGFGIGGSNAAAGMLLGAASVGIANFRGSEGIGSKLYGLGRGIVKGGMAGSNGGNYAQNMDRVKSREAGRTRFNNELKAEGAGVWERHRALVAARTGGMTNRDWDEIALQQDEDLANAIKKDDTYKFFKDMSDHMDATHSNTYEDLSSGKKFKRRNDGTFVEVDKTSGAEISGTDFNFKEYTENVVWGNSDGKHKNVEIARRNLNRTKRLAGKRYFDGADASGTHEAWNAAQKSRAANKPPKRVPGARRPF